jgi:hypothetical protein
MDTIPLNDTVFNIYLPLSSDFWEKGSSAVLDTVPLNNTYGIQNLLTLELGLLE